MKKRVMGSLQLVCLLFVFGMIIGSAESRAETYQVGVLDFPPFYVVKSETDVSGTMTDLLKKILNKAGMEYEIRGYPPKRLYKNLVDGKSHIFLGIKGLPVYNDHVLYGDSDVDEIEIRVYSREGTPVVSSIPELNGKKIIAIRGYEYGGLIAYLNKPENQITLDPTDSHDLAFKKLLKGRGDYVLDYKSPAETYLQSVNQTGLVHGVLKNIKVNLIISKKTPDAENVVKKMEDAYKALVKEGAI